jgi:hypothetical protein
MTRKPKNDTDNPSNAAGVDDRHLPHPHGVAVDPAGGAVFDGSFAAADATAKPEKPTADGDPDAVGFMVLEDCPDPAEDDSSGGDGVGAVVRDDCDDSADRTTIDTGATPQRRRAVAAASQTGTDTSVAAGMGAAVLPDGRVIGNAGPGHDVREGYGLVFSG